MFQKPKRLHWLDSLRGVLILMMTVYHFGFDLSLFAKGSVDPYSTPWVLLARVVQFGFLTVVGASLYLSSKNAPDYPQWLRRMELRALKLFCVAMGITLVTWIAVPEGFIRFGILHLISASILLGALLLPSVALTTLSLLLSLALGIYFSGLTTPYSFLIPFGIVPDSFYTYDYFPLFPWLSVVLAGILIARWLDRRSLLKNPSKLGRSFALEKIGQRSLLIYLLHQPILLGILWALFHL
jgi:uncharacterized membrane protein